MPTAAIKTFSLQADTTNPAALPWLEATKAFAKEKVPEWVTALRATGAESFARTGLPTTE